MYTGVLALPAYAVPCGSPLCIGLFFFLKIKGSNTAPHQGLLLTSGFYLKLISQREEQPLKRKAITSQQQGPPKAGRQRSPSTLPRLAHYVRSSSIARVRSLFYRATIPVSLHLPSIFREESQGKQKKEWKDLDSEFRRNPTPSPPPLASSGLESLPQHPLPKNPLPIFISGFFRI
jgi:hypothetical protein